MNVKAIHNQDDLDATLARIDDLMDMNEGQGPLPETDEFNELDVLSVLAEAYEENAFPLGEIEDPIEAVLFALEQRGLERADLGKILGSRSRASELLNGNMKGLSRHMMQVLHRHLKIPAEILIRDIPQDDKHATA